MKKKIVKGRKVFPAWQHITEFDLSREKMEIMNYYQWGKLLKVF